MELCASQNIRISGRDIVDKNGFADAAAAAAAPASVTASFSKIIRATGQVRKQGTGYF